MFFVFVVSSSSRLWASQSKKIFAHVVIVHECAWLSINFIKLLLQRATNFESFPNQNVSFVLRYDSPNYSG
jgi:hypothetical protein